MNNRQNGRRRGRGGQRPQGLGGGGGGGNSRDQRVRGNAAQLLEKYKNMARDAQLAGDRVQTEYYLQFADHYFRVLSENRSRFEDQRPHRDDDEDEGEDDLIEGEGDEDVVEQRPERQPRGERQDRGDRSDRGDRYERRERSPDRDRNSDRPRRERLERRPRDEQGDEREVEQTAGIAIDMLPPAIGPVGADEPLGDEGEEAPRPRRRTRRPRAAEGGEEIAPAA